MAANINFSENTYRPLQWQSTDTFPKGFTPDHVSSWKERYKPAKASSKETKSAIKHKNTNKHTTSPNTATASTHATKGYFTSTGSGENSGVSTGSATPEDRKLYALLRDTPDWPPSNKTTRPLGVVPTEENAAPPLGSVYTAGSAASSRASSDWTDTQHESQVLYVDNGVGGETELHMQGQVWNLSLLHSSKVKR